MDLISRQDATKKSVPENEETIQDVFGTFNEKQRLAPDPVLWRDDLMELFV